MYKWEIVVWSIEASQVFFMSNETPTVLITYTFFHYYTCCVHSSPLWFACTAQFWRHTGKWDAIPCAQFKHTGSKLWLLCVSKIFAKRVVHTLTSVIWWQVFNQYLMHGFGCIFKIWKAYMSFFKVFALAYNKGYKKLWRLNQTPLYYWVEIRLFFRYALPTVSIECVTNRIISCTM